MSNGMKHTPGPWAQSHRKQPNGGYVTQVYCEKGETIASLAWYPVEMGDGITGTSREANARLIAAAPDLLLALDDLLFAYCDPGNQGGDHDDKVEAARAAIAKARGE